MITYGAAVWHGKTELATTRKTLEKMQRLECLCITEALRSTPTATLEVILDLTPLHIMMRRTAWEHISWGNYQEVQFRTTISIGTEHQERLEKRIHSNIVSNINSMMVLECLGKLNDLGRNNKVTLGHVEVEGNEQADTLIGPEPFCGIEKAYVQQELNKAEEELRDLLGNFNRARSKTLINLSQISFKALTRFLTGHG